MEQLREVAAVPPVSEERLDAVRSRLAATWAVAAPPGRRSFLRVPQRALAMAAAVVLSGGSLAVWAVTSSHVDPRTNLTIECGPDTFIPAEGPSPVLDCYASLANEEATVPPLTGWITPTGLVAVLPTGDAPPAGSRLLPASFQVDASIRYATDALGDASGPLQSGCLDARAAVAYASSQLAIAGLSGFTVTVSTPAGSYACPSYAAILDAAHRSVSLVPAGGWDQAAATNVTVVLDQRLARQLAVGCASTSDAMALARSDAATLGIASSGLIVTDGGSVGGASGCAAAFVEPAGFVDVVVWQVARTS